jgi:type IV pilus assembly protein PilO
MAAPKSSGDQSFAKLPTGGKIALLALLIALICAVYFFALHMSVSDDITSANSRHAQLLAQLQEAQERNAEYVRLREELAARESLDRSNLRALPESSETASFLQDLNRLAELSGLRMRLVEPRPEEPDAHYVRLPVNLQLAGRYHQLARFFYNVSRLDRLISMENIRLSEPRLEGEEVLLNVDVLATTYRRPRPDEAQAATATAPAAGGGGGT